MRINSINTVQTRNRQNATRKFNAVQAQSFKGSTGAKIGLAAGGIGSLWGMAAIGLALTNPIGWGTAAALYFGAIGTTAATTYAGHKIEDAFTSGKKNKK